MKRPRKSRSHEVRVLEVVRAPDGTTRYVDQVIAHPASGITFKFMSIRRMVLLDYDVAHFHWPEMLVRHRNPLVETLRCVAADWWTWRLVRRQIGIVRTLHNPVPHEAVRPRVRRTLARLDERTNVFVALNSSTTVPAGDVMVIPHGHYRDRFGAREGSPVPGRLLYAGLIRPYKGVSDLLRSFKDVEAGDMSLRIVGKPTADLRVEVESEVEASAGRVSARLEFVPDDDLVNEMLNAELVCLPYRELHNSGIMLVALSLNRPVLVPDTPTTRALGEEVGNEWVVRFNGQLSGRTLEAALDAVRARPKDARPKLSNRDWSVVGQRYSDAFFLAASGDRERN